MKLASLIRKIADAGASPEVIALVVEFCAADVPEKPRSLGPHGAKQRLTSDDLAKQILEEVSERHAVAPEAILGPGRFSVYIQPRQEVMWRLRSDLGWSYPKIAAFLGNRDHTTVMYGVKRHQALLDHPRARPLYCAASVAEGAPPG